MRLAAMAFGSHMYADSAQAKCGEKVEVRKQVDSDWQLSGDTAFSLESGGTLMNLQSNDCKLYAYVHADIATSNLKDLHRAIAKLAAT